MKWKYKSPDKLIWFSLLIALLFTISQAHSQSRYKGIHNPPSANVNWKNYAPEIQQKLATEILEALKLGISNIDLFEYSFILEELLKSYSNDGFQENWKSYMVSLENEANKMIIRSGLIPLQSEFFHATLDANLEYKFKYPEAFAFIKENTPLMIEMGWKPEEFPAILEKYAFSEAIGEGIIMDLLMLEDVYLLELIDQNQQLKERYKIWLTNLVDTGNAFQYSEKRPSEIFTRKKLYLVEKLKKSKNALAQESWRPIKGIMTMKFPEIASDHFFKVLNGTWQGIYITNKTIRISLYPISNVNPERKLKGQNKFDTQEDKDLIYMEGSFEDRTSYFEVTMYELPKSKPLNGVFKVMIDKGSQQMKGNWTSYDKTLKRDFSIPKISEGLN